MQGMDGSLFKNFPGYPNGEDDIVARIDGKTYVKTPNVLRAVRVCVPVHVSGKGLCLRIPYLSNYKW